MLDKTIYGKVFDVNGQACVAISSVFTLASSLSNVAVYDMDAGRIFHMPVSEVKQAKTIRDAEEEDYEWEAIMMSDYADDAFEISCDLFV